MTQDYYFDIGNSRGKFWRVSDGVPVAKATISHFGDMYAMLNQLPKEFREAPVRLRGACVLGQRQADEFSVHCRKLWGVSPDFAKSTAECKGVNSAYLEAPASLGIDRWLQLVALGQRGPANVCLVSCGTALTIDVLQQKRHRGGYVLPGFLMAVEAIKDGTGLIAARLGPVHFGSTALGQNTSEGVLNGVLAAAAAIVEKVVNEYGVDCVVLTGGDAECLSTQLSCTARVESDLILAGMQVYFECAS